VSLSVVTINKFHTKVQLIDKTFVG